MKVIGHRGAAGLALENTLASFELAKLIGVDAIELDIRLTLDQQLVVVHDGDLKKISGNNLTIKSHNYKQISSITLRDGQSRIPTLESVMQITDNVPLIIEIKAENCVQPLVELLEKHSSREIVIVSFKHNELSKLRQLLPDYKIYVNEQTKPIEIIQIARRMKLNGIGLNYWLLNPLTYWAAKRNKIDIFVYTVNNRLIGRMINFLYPDVAICTDHPEYFIKNSYPLEENITNNGLG